MRSITQLAALTLLSLCASAFGTGRAVLIGVDAYKQFEPLKGAGRDVEKMTRLLNGYGFQSIKPLVDKDASSLAIRKYLKTSPSTVQAGDQVLFYFSGRGSIAWDKKAPGKIDMAEPMLVPIDGLKADTSNDIRFSEIEAWSHQIKLKGATPIVMVDACFVDPTRAFYEGKLISTPKVARRTAYDQIKRTRLQLYGGEGVFICAGGPQGGAYEWQVSKGTGNDWEGAFTSLFYERARAAQGKREVLSYTEILRRTQGYFVQAQHQGYLIGLMPYPLDTTLANDKRGLYDAVAFNARSLQVPGAELLQEIKARQKFRQTLRVLIHYDAEKQDSGLTAAQASAIADDLVPKTRVAIQKVMDLDKLNATVIRESEDLPDIIVNVCKRSDQVQLRLYGDVQDQSQYPGGDPTYVGKDVETAVRSAMDEYIVPHGLFLLLFRLHEDGNPTLTEPCSVTMDRTSPLAPNPDGNYYFTLHFQAPKQTCMVLVDQDEIDGRAQLVFPATETGTGKVSSECFPFLQDPSGATEKAGAPPGQMSAGASKETPGAVRLRGIFVQASAEELPILSPNDSVQQLCAFLKKLLDGIYNGIYKWRTSELQYRVKGQGG